MPQATSTWLWLSVVKISEPLLLQLLRTYPLHSRHISIHPISSLYSISVSIPDWMARTTYTHARSDWHTQHSILYMVDKWKRRFCHMTMTRQQHQRRRRWRMKMYRHTTSKVVRKCVNVKCMAEKLFSAWKMPHMRSMWWGQRRKGEKKYSNVMSSMWEYFCAYQYWNYIMLGSGKALAYYYYSFPYTAKGPSPKYI